MTTVGKCYIIIWSDNRLNFFLLEKIFFIPVLVSAYKTYTPYRKLKCVIHRKLMAELFQQYNRFSYLILSTFAFCIVYVFPIANQFKRFSIFLGHYAFLSFKDITIESIKKVNHNERKYERFNYTPVLYEKLRYVLFKHSIHLIAYPPRKFKD